MRVMDRVFIKAFRVQLALDKRLMFKEFRGETGPVFKALKASRRVVYRIVRWTDSL